MDAKTHFDNVHLADVPLYIMYAGPPVGINYEKPQQMHMRLSIGNDTIVIEADRKMPNAWHRFWYRILLGWQWEKLNDG